ncbi:CRISPR-associated endoribonuclease Cas6 [Xanthocytophaga flava]|uniref:CRISPR-associated endoribonuclease Cas6 n=1 Tax=Xanthocytophaga flava TaxID=3048013 RepID=UPI0028D12325|nr:CRISPR-associated endoribonuclease Cas6 [Xanthocytophaga flavus]MDJ1473777.1 CRISPR-associated endoribonuclease Cas6 [Xanthocytophaga flavus]
MRLKLTLQKTGSQSTLPINYAYPLSSWIYKVIGKADETYADFLHNSGYSAGQKRFKFFTFSALQIPRFDIRKGSDRIAVLSDEVGLMVSFYTDKAAENFVMGLFAEQEFRLGDRISQVDFRVKQVESLAWQIPSETVHLRTLSPLVVSRKNDRGHDDYYSPLQEGYQELLFTNLLDKYIASGQSLQASWANAPMEFRLLSAEPKARLITLKDHSPEATKIKGYLFDFELTAPRKLLEIGLLGGFGRYNAEGFGCCEVKG